MEPTAAKCPVSGMLAGIAGKVRAAFDKNPTAMTMQMARELQVPELEVIRALPDGRATELDGSRWMDILRELEAVGQVHVISSNEAVTLEVFGQFGNFSQWGGFFNVQSKTLDMHIREAMVKTVMAVRKPSHMDGVETLSLQFFAESGAAAFKVFLTFGAKVPTAERMEEFKRIREMFRVG